MIDWLINFSSMQFSVKPQDSLFFVGSYPFAGDTVCVLSASQTE